jgi:capsid protein
MEPIGYQRSRRSEPIGETYRSLLPDELPKWRLKLRDRMDEAIGAIDVARARQRTLMAKLIGLRDRCHHPSGLSAEDRKTAEAVLAAAEAIIKAVEEATKPVL